MAFTPSALGSYLSTLGPNGADAPTGPASSFTAPAQMDWSNPQAGLGQDIMDYLKNNQVASTTPEGKWGAGQAQIGINGAGMYVLPGGDASFGTPGYGVVSGGQGGGYYYKPLDGNKTNAANYSYNPDGSYNHTDYNSHIMSPAQGVASVIGAGLGFGAIGAMAGGAAAAGEGAGAAGGTFGAGGLGTGTATGGVGYGLSGGADFTGLAGSTYGGVGGLSGVDFGAGAAGAAAGGAAGGAAGSQFGGGLGTGTPTGASYGLGAPSYGGSELASGYDWASAAAPASGFSMSDALKTISKAYGQMGQQQTQQAQTPIASSQSSQPGTFVSPTPGFYSIASPAKKPQMLSGMNEGNPYMSGLMRGMYGY